MALIRILAVFLILATILLPTARHVSAAPAASATVTLTGPCLGYSPQMRGNHKVSFGLGEAGVQASRAPHGLQKEWMALDACAPRSGPELAVGVLFSNRLAYNRASPFIGLGYRISLGRLSFGVGAGLVVGSLVKHRTHYQVFLPFAGFQISGTF